MACAAEPAFGSTRVRGSLLTGRSGRILFFVNGVCSRACCCIYRSYLQESEGAYLQVDRGELFVLWRVQQSLLVMCEWEEVGRSN